MIFDWPEIKSFYVLQFQKINLTFCAVWTINFVIFGSKCWYVKRQWTTPMRWFLKNNWEEDYFTSKIPLDSLVVSFGATILIFYLVTAQRTADFGSIFLNDHTRGKKSDEANILVHYGRIFQVLSTTYRLFFVWSIAQFFTQIYMNVGRLVHKLNKLGKFW